MSLLRASRSTIVSARSFVSFTKCSAVAASTYIPNINTLKDR
jgi:hypothetical protein